MVFQEIQQIFDATGSVAVADIMGRRVVKTKLRGRDPVIHLLIDAGVSNPLLAGCDDQRRGLDRRNLVHEIVGAHVKDEAGNEGRVVRSGLLDKPLDQLGIGRGVKSLVDRVGKKLLEADLLDLRYPCRRMTMLEARSRSERASVLTRSGWRIANCCDT